METKKKFYPFRMVGGETVLSSAAAFNCKLSESSCGILKYITKRKNRACCSVYSNEAEGVGIRIFFKLHFFSAKQQFTDGLANCVVG